MLRGVCTLFSRTGLRVGHLLNAPAGTPGRYRGQGMHLFSRTGLRVGHLLNAPGRDAGSLPKPGDVPSSVGPASVPVIFSVVISRRPVGANGIRPGRPPVAPTKTWHPSGRLPCHITNIREEDRGHAQGGAPTIPGTQSQVSPRCRGSKLGYVPELLGGIHSGDMTRFAGAQRRETNRDRVPGIEFSLQ